VPPAHLALTDSGRTRFSKRFATVGATHVLPPCDCRPAIEAPKVAALLSRFAGKATGSCLRRQALEAATVERLHRVGPKRHDSVGATGTHSSRLRGSWRVGAARLLAATAGLCAEAAVLMIGGLPLVPQRESKSTLKSLSNDENHGIVKPSHLGLTIPIASTGP
jgi:hypothetical protein